MLLSHLTGCLGHGGGGVCVHAHVHAKVYHKSAPQVCLKDASSGRADLSNTVERREGKGWSSLFNLVLL